MIVSRRHLIATMGIRQTCSACIINEIFGCVFQLTVGIAMGNNCAPLIAGLFRKDYSYEVDYMQEFLKKNDRKLGVAMENIIEQLTVKRVTSEDYDKVMAIRGPEDVYNGHDYLPSYFNSLIDSSNVMAFVVVHGDEFIAFDAAFFVDEGETVVTRAARVSKKYEGHGVMSYLLNHMQDVIKSTTTAAYHVYAAENHTEHGLEKMKRAHYDVVFEKNNAEFHASKRTIKDLLRGKKDSNTVTKRLNHDDLQNVFENEDLSSRLFHQSSVIVDWVPYRPIKSNISSIFTQTTSVIGSNLGDIDKAFLTFGNHFRTVDGLMFEIDIYGNQWDLIYSHILQHMQNCEDDNVLIRLFYDKNVTDNIVSIVKDVSLSREDTKYERQVFVKRVLRERSKT